MLIKNINIPFLGISIVVAVGLIWAGANFFNIRSGMVSQNKNMAPVLFDTIVLETDQQSLVAADSEIYSLNQDESIFAEIDQTSDDISGASDLTLDKKSLNDEASLADISGDISALDNGDIQNEVDQSMGAVLQ